MRYILNAIMLFSLISCNQDKPKICEIKHRFDKVILEPTKNNCKIEPIIIYERSELNLIFEDLCKSKEIFILNRQGDLWYVNIYIDGFDDKLLSLTKTVHDKYYFRDKHGTYSNDKLAYKIIKLTNVECD